MKELEAVSKSTAENDTKSTDNVEQNISLESVQKAKENAYTNENLLTDEDQVIFFFYFLILTICRIWTLGRIFLAVTLTWTPARTAEEDGRV